MLMADAGLEVKPGQAAALPPELEQLAGLAAAADAQLAGAEQLPGAPGAEPAVPEVSEHQAIAGFLVMVASVAGMAVPPVATAYTPEACGAIATEYLRCADLYGWTFHRSASNPVIGLVAAAAMPVVMNLPAFMAWNAQRKAAAAANTPPAQAQQLQAVDQVDERPHAGSRL